MKTISALLSGAVLLLGSGHAFASHTCTSTFDNMASLFMNSTQARDTFSYKTMLTGPGGSYVRCGADERNCFDYREFCGNEFVGVWPGSQNHFHLMFENPAMSENCVFNPDGTPATASSPAYGWGLQTPSGCAFTPWYRQPRFLTPHVGDEWQLINVRPNEVNTCQGPMLKDCDRPFNFNTLWVGGTKTVQVWVLLPDGLTWNIFRGLGPNVNWNFGGIRAREVWVTNGNYFDVYEIHGFSVTVDS
jgi:hypothetical protein